MTTNEQTLDVLRANDFVDEQAILNKSLFELFDFGLEQSQIAQFKQMPIYACQSGGECADWTG